MMHGESNSFKAAILWEACVMGSVVANSNSPRIRGLVVQFELAKVHVAFPDHLGRKATEPNGITKSLSRVLSLGS